MHNKPAITLRYDRFEIDPNLSLAEKMKATGDKLGNLVEVDTERFRFSQVIDSMFYYYQTIQDTTETLNIESIHNSNNNNYIIPIAVAYHPNDWTDHDNTKKSVLDFLHPKYLEDLRNKKALLLIDQSVEGYNAIWLWEWFHNKCRQLDIPPASIMYLTGDQSSTDSYEQWCAIHNPSSKLKVIPSTSLTTYLHKHYQKYNLDIDFDKILEYKKSNSANIYLYDCINLRPRPQRILNFLHLVSAGLIDDGNISMADQKDWYFDFSSDAYLNQYNLSADIKDKLDSSMTPRTAKHNYSFGIVHYYNYVERILDDLYKNSWLSIVTESSYFDFEYATFLGEKTFKPIACMQPFIILGSKGSLKYLRKLGYKTFHPYIDESYDDLDDKDRFVAIVNAINKIKAIEDKASWYDSVRDIVEHNHQLFLSTNTRKSSEHTAIIKYYFNYFEEIDV